MQPNQQRWEHDKTFLVNNVFQFCSQQRPHYQQVTRLMLRTFSPVIMPCVQFFVHLTVRFFVDWAHLHAAHWMRRLWVRWALRGKKGCNKQSKQTNKELVAVGHEAMGVWTSGQWRLRFNWINIGIMDVMIEIMVLITFHKAHTLRLFSSEKNEQKWTL